MNKHSLANVIQEHQISVFMKKVSIGLAIAGVLICWSCVVTDVDQTANLNPYKSFGWGKSNLIAKNPAYKSDLIDSHIKFSIKTGFASKGMTYNAKKPDLLVSYEAYTEDKERGYGGGTRYYYPYYYPYYSFGFFPFGGYGMGWPLWGYPQGSYSYTQGTLIINMRDRKTGKLVWRGIVQGDVDNVKTLRRNISKGVKAIMKKYPAAPPTLIPIPKERVS